MQPTLTQPITRIATGPRTSRTVVHAGTVYVAGQVAKKSAGADVATQTAEVLASIDELLAKAGSSKEKLLMATIFLADIADFEAMNSVWDQWVPQGDTPARATVQATLAMPDLKVEIVATAAA